MRLLEFIVSNQRHERFNTVSSTLFRSRLLLGPKNSGQTKRGESKWIRPLAFSSWRRSALVFRSAGTHQFRGAGACRGVEGQLFLAVHFLQPDRNGVLAVERALEQFLGQRILDRVLDGATQRPGAELRA